MVNDEIFSFFYHWLFIDVLCPVMDYSLLILDNDLILETTTYWDYPPDNIDLFELMTGQ